MKNGYLNNIYLRENMKYNRHALIENINIEITIFSNNKYKKYWE